ncbi:MAG TPA: hypothetical protein DCE55_28845 [Planctomycetaceae bacterium]|nr:hypothetical protein [Planctomycetaceae bacterium]|tara:strand:+ start:13221 stop:16436 length:3216 start_codon:yes stop_codon:yes gene_type:complete
MSRIVGTPSNAAVNTDGLFPAGWWHETEETGRICCDLCPRECQLKPGDRGFCFVRENHGGQMVLTTYGRSTGFCIDPIEKKPLNHFFPGSSVLSFGTAGCNLGCKFCQNWDISKSREVDRLSERAFPETIANAALQLGCKSVAYTYNDPVIWAEYAIDTAKACRQVGVQSIAVTAGYISPPAREPFFEYMDAANVDLKSFSEEFYQKITYSHLQPVLETLEWIHRETDVWLEVTNLLIPEANDQPEEIRRMCQWLLSHVGDEVPLHLTAFHPDYRMRDRPRTPRDTLLEARRLALDEGLKFVYAGNISDADHQSTICPSCHRSVIERRGYELGLWNLQENRCGGCGAVIAGCFDLRPGDWGAQRKPINISDFSVVRKQGTNIAPQPAVTALLPVISSASFLEPPPVMNDIASLDSRQTESIHRLAASMIVAEVAGGDCPRSAVVSLPDDLVIEGAFTTLKRRGRLRACCGTLGKTMGLEEALQMAASRTVFQDPRFPPVTTCELPFLELDVTLLHGFKPVKAAGLERLSKVRIGKHGVQVRRSGASGLLLPEVAVECGWDVKTLLEQVCRKAGLSHQAWQDNETQLTIFEGQSIGGLLDKVLEGHQGREVSPVFTPEVVQRIAGHGLSNLIRLLQGATPDYYLADCPDGSVAGVAVRLSFTGSLPSRTFSQWSLRPGLPLQATLFRQLEAAAAWLRDCGERQVNSSNVCLDVAVLTAPAVHGTVTHPDLRGVESAQRAVLVSAPSQSSWVFDPCRSPEELVAEACQYVQDPARQGAAIYSLRVVSTVQHWSAQQTAIPATSTAVRGPAVAGSFYPAEEAMLAVEVNRMLAGPLTSTEPWPALMVPHAGLAYSGSIAAEVFRQVQIPSTVIILGPKHTGLGAQWAVAPHASWQLPGATMAANVELSRRLAREIPGFELDALAHEREHAIEVELPFLASLAPAARVVGIVLGAASLSRCFEFSAALAEVISSLEETPLLVISSDMNHFANDDENRRLDELALRAMESLDPATLHRCVTENQISMCGVLPAVVVMDTLLRLGCLSRMQRVGYATSADVNNRRDKVVGYAGVLLG